MTIIHIDDFLRFIMIMLASYSVMTMIEYEKWGPFNIVKVYELVFNKLTGSNCRFCLSFWVALTMFFLPDIILTGLSFMAVNLLLDDWRNGYE